MTIDISTVTEVVCTGRRGREHDRRVLARYARQAADPPQWWEMPAQAAIDAQGQPGRLEPVHWPRVGDGIAWRCRDCGQDRRRRLDRVYDWDFPPLSTVLEVLHTNGVHEVDARALDKYIAWPSRE